MPPRDKMIRDAEGEEVITAKDLGYIIDVNKKAIEINIEVEKQNEQVISQLDDVSDRIDEIIKNQIEIRIEQKEIKRLVDENKEISEEVKETSSEIKKDTAEMNTTIKGSLEKKIDEIEKNLFRLVIILGSAGLSTAITVIQSFLHK